MAVYFNPYMNQGFGAGIYTNPYQQSGGYPAVNYPIVKPEAVIDQQVVGQAMKWVEGEVGAKAYQMPIGWPVNQPIPLWDSTDTVIYLKSWNQMGMPNPLQKIKYTMVEDQNQMNPEKLNGMSGAMNIPQENQPAEASSYATKSDFESLREELESLKEAAVALQSSLKSNNYSNNQNGNKNMNRGGNNNG